MKMRFATVSKYCEQEWIQKVTKEVLRVVTVLLSHQIDNVECIDSPSDHQREFSGPGLLLHLLRDVISRYAPFRSMMEFQSEPALVPSHKSVKYIFLISLENGQ
jgi:hypothetical protein